MTNTGSVKGDEVVQFYGVDKVASFIRPAEELIGFKRITLEPEEMKTVRFIFNIDILAFYDKPKHWILEKGEFEFYVGKNSKEVIFSAIVAIEETHEIDYTKRWLIAEATC